MKHAAQPAMAQPREETVASTFSYAALSDDELERHIQDCGAHLVVAYERFQQSGNPHDRDEACMWQEQQRQAILARRPGRVVAMEACYFHEMGGAHAARMGAARR